MHSVQAQILEVFKQDTQVKTSDFVKKIFPKEMSLIQKDLAITHLKPQALHQKARLHRQLLHHIHTLLRKGLIVAVKKISFGENVYALNIGSHQSLEIETGVQKLVLQSRVVPLHALDGYIQSKSMYTGDSHLLDAVLFEPRVSMTLKDFTRQILTYSQYINDVVGINDFEQLIYAYPLLDVVTAITTMHEKMSCAKLCLIFDLTNITQEKSLEEFFLLLVKQQTTNINIVFDSTPKELALHHDFLESVARIFASYSLKFNIKNDDVHKAPYIVGKVGPYTLEPSVWEHYLSQYHHAHFGIILCQTQLVIDCGRFFEKYKSAKEFEKCITLATKHLLYLSQQQRHTQSELFRLLVKDPAYIGSHFFMAGQSFIRFINYQQVLDQLTSILDVEKRAIHAITHIQQTIFRSCGIPTTCTIGFAQAYRRFLDSSQDSSDVFNAPKVSIKGVSDLYLHEIQKELSSVVSATKILSGASELRIYREGYVTSSTIIGEISVCMNTYCVPFICYTFDTHSLLNKQLGEYFAH
jgi:hypothetical protein